MTHVRGLLRLLAAASVALVAASTAGASSDAYAASCRSDGARPRVLLIGDSNIYGDLGKALETRLRAQGWTTLRFGKPTSGLARPDFFNWLEAAPKLLEAYEPDRVIVMFGGNDGQRLVPPEGRRRGDPHPVWFRLEARWRAGYEARVEALMHVLSGDGAHGPRRDVVLLGPTNRRPRKARERMVRVREAMAAAAARVEGVTFVDTYEASSGPGGRWLHREIGERGRFVRFRRADGIHLTPEGGARVADRLMPELIATGLDRVPAACRLEPEQAAVAVLVPDLRRTRQRRRPSRRDRRRTLAAAAASALGEPPRSPADASGIPPL